MQTVSGARAAQAKDWTKAHPFVAATLAGFLGLLVGVGSGASGKSDLEARLASAKSQARATSSSSAKEIDRLESSTASLQSDLEDAREENKSLHAQVKRLNAKRELPKLVGLSNDYASRLEDKYGWTLQMDVRYSADEPGTVLSQSPAPGTMMSYGASFTITVAKEIPKVAAVVGESKSAAVRSLEGSGYQVVVVEQVSTKKPGTVLAMSPGAGSRLIPGEMITLTIAKKAPPAPPVPDVSTSGGGCTPGYDPCLEPASDYDCLGGTGDGPEYTGYVTVTGSDPYGLDADNDGVGCE
jgi:hypothetical protein